jgi:heat shock protein HslJ
MSSSKIRNVVLSGLLVTMAACSPAGPEDESSMVAEIVPLEGTNWQLVELTVLGGFVFVPEDRSDYVLNFRSENRLTGTSDCNSIAGSWQQDDTALRFEPYSSTRSLCAPGSLHSYLDLYLKDVEALSFRDGLMVLTTPTEGVEIKFESRE